MDSSHPEFLWIVILSGIMSGVLAMAIGANDVANAFAASVGSGTLSLTMAIGLAFVFEILGALLLGGTVTDSIRKEVLNFEAFRDAPIELALGMFTASCGAASWLLFSTWFGMPVSTTHSIIGALAGFGVASGRVDSVRWLRVLYIMLSWLTLPVVALSIAGLFYTCLQEFIIAKTKKSFKILRNCHWIFMAIACVPLSVFLAFENPLAKNITNHSYAKWLRASAWNKLIAVAISFSCIFTLFESLVNIVAHHRLKRKWSHLKRERKLDNIFTRRISGWVKEFAAQHAAQKSPDDSDVEYLMNTIDESLQLGTRSSTRRASNIAKLYSTASNKSHSVNFEEGADMEASNGSGPDDEGNDNYKDKKEIKVNVESNEHKTEVFFSALQIVGALIVIVAHSANDTANAVAPFATVLLIYKEGIDKPVTDTPWYLLLCGGCFMSLGLAFLGYRVIRTVGLSLFNVTPSRGFAIDTTVGNLIILLCHLGIPVSSTQCTVSSTLGVGLVGNLATSDATDKNASLKNEKTPMIQGSAKKQNNSRLKAIFARISIYNISLDVFKKIIISWISTMLFSGIASAVLYIVIIFCVRAFTAGQQSAP